MKHLLSEYCGMVSIWEILQKILALTAYGKISNLFSASIVVFFFQYPNNGITLGHFLVVWWWTWLQRCQGTVCQSWWKKNTSEDFSHFCVYTDWCQRIGILFYTQVKSAVCDQSCLFFHIRRKIDGTGHLQTWIDKHFTGSASSLTIVSFHRSCHQSMLCILWEGEKSIKSIAMWIYHLI